MDESKHNSQLTAESERELKQLANQLFSRATILATELIRRDDLRLELENRLDALGFGLVINTKLNLALVYGLPVFEDDEADDREWVSITMKAIIVALFVHLQLPNMQDVTHAGMIQTSPSIDANTIQKLLPNLSDNQIRMALPRLKRLGYLHGAQPPYSPGSRLLTLPGATMLKEALINEEFFYSFEIHQAKEQGQVKDDYSEHAV